MFVLMIIQDFWKKQQMSAEAVSLKLAPHFLAEENTFFFFFLNQQQRVLMNIPDFLRNSRCQQKLLFQDLKLTAECFGRKTFFDFFFFTQ